MFHSDGVCRPSVRLVTPLPSARPSVNDSVGLWQVAHDTELSTDKRPSENKRRPNSFLATEGMLSAG